MTRFTLPLLLLLTTAVFGQNLRDSLSTTLLAPATVTSTRLTTNELAAPYSLSVVSLPAAQSGRQRLSPQEFLPLLASPPTRSGGMSA